MRVFLFIFYAGCFCLSVMLNESVFVYLLCWMRVFLFIFYAFK